MTDFETECLVQDAMWGGFYYCPTTRRIIASLPGDDKTICHCRRSNPAVPAERAEHTGVHINRFMDPAPVEAWVRQNEEERRVRQRQGRD